MPFADARNPKVVKRLPGWYGRYFQSPSMTFVHYDFTRGSSIHKITSITSVVSFLLAVTVSLLAEAAADFSGVYNLASVSGDHAAKNVPKRTLKLVQNGNSLEIEQVLDGSQGMCSSYELDGSESQNATWDGDPTVDKAVIKGKNLVIQSSHHLPSGILVRETQKWELSSDRKTLKVHRQKRVPELPTQNETIIEMYARQ